MTIPNPIDIFVTPKQWYQITPFAVTLGTGPTLQSVVVLARLDLDRDGPWGRLARHSGKSRQGDFTRSRNEDLDHRFCRSLSMGQTECQTSRLVGRLIFAG